MGFTSSLSALGHLWVMYYHHPVAILFTKKFLKMDVNWGRTNSNFFVYVPLLIFLLIFFIIIVFYLNSHNTSVDKIKKSSKVFLEQGKNSNDCCFFEENESFQLDCTVRNPCVNGTFEIKQRKIVFLG